MDKLMKHSFELFKRPFSAYCSTLAMPDLDDVSRNNWKSARNPLEMGEWLKAEKNVRCKRTLNYLREKYSKVWRTFSFKKCSQYIQ